jgi:unsaturated rhamnogalacturonyl hydrolase
MDQSNDDPLDIATLLSNTYGHELSSPLTYPTGVALSGRLRLANIVGDNRSVTLDDVDALTSALVTTPDTIPDAAPCLATGCFAQDCYERTGDSRFVRFIVQLADRFERDSDVRVEDFFFSAVLLGQAYALSEKPDYADSLMTLLIDADTFQSNGLYWHCHSSPWFWGRGNAFAALGVAEALTYVPEHSQREQLLARHRDHLAAIGTLQHSSGMWHQVVDDTSSYLEHSATTMFGCAIARGIRLGWLPESSWLVIVERAWQGVASRIGSGGELAQVCVGTGPLAGAEEYLNRPCSNGRDDRGGAMALWFAVEMMRLRATQ